MEKPIHKVGAAILRDKKLLVVRKLREDRVVYILPGGKAEAHEEPLQTLTRELREELQIELVSASYLRRFRANAVFEDAPLAIDVYLVDFEGIPTPDSEIKECVWIDRTYRERGINLSPVLDVDIVPYLVSRGLM